MRRRKLYKLFTDAGCVFVADKKKATWDVQG
jgi:hypothetical protein